MRSLSFTSSFTADLPAITPGAADPPEGKTTPEAVGERLETSEHSELEESVGVGTVSGFVMNASGGEIPAGLDVSLHGFDQMQVVMTETTTLQEDGSYLFADVELPIGRVFLTTIEFGGTTYGSDIARVEQAEDSIELPIQIYETTTEISGLFADRLHMFFEQLDEDTVRVWLSFISFQILATRPSWLRSREVLFWSLSYRSKPRI